MVCHQYCPEPINVTVPLIPSSLRQSILQQVHDAPGAGHPRSGQNPRESLQLTCFLCMRMPSNIFRNVSTANKPSGLSLLTDACSGCPCSSSLAHAYKIVTLVTHIGQSCGDPVDKPALQSCYPQHLRRSADRLSIGGEAQGVCIKYIALILQQGLILCTAHLCYVRDLCTALCNKTVYPVIYVSVLGEAV